MSYDETEEKSIVAGLAATTADQTIGDLQSEAKSLGVSAPKLAAMKNYAVMLRKTEPKIKISTVRRKVAQKFNVKLV